MPAEPRGGPRVVHLTTVHRALDPRIFHKECGTLRDAGFDVHVIAPHTHSEKRAGITITALPLVRGRTARMRLQRLAYQAAREAEAALYHFHDPELIPVAYALKHATGACVVYDMHENYRWHGPVQGRLLRQLEHWCFRWIDHIVLADDVLARITTKAGVPATLIPNYFKPYEEAPLTPKSVVRADPIRLLYTGVISKGRGLDTMLDLCQLLDGAPGYWQLDLVGVCYRERERRRTEARMKQPAVARVLSTTGWNRYVPPEQMVPFYRSAQVGLALLHPLPNYAEVIPTKFYEYLYYGLPILCSDIPLWRQFVTKHDCGAVVAHDNPGAAARVLQQWREAPALYERLSTAARSVAPRYQWGFIGQRLVALYRSLLDGEEPEAPSSNDD